MKGGFGPLLLGDFKMSDLNVIGADVYASHELPIFKPGTQLTVGDTTYIYLRARTGGTQTRNYFYAYGVTTSGVMTCINANGLRSASVLSRSDPLGVCVAHTRSNETEGTITIPANYYFWGAIAGKVRGFVGTNCAANVKMYTSTGTGVVDDDPTSQDIIPGLSCVNSVTSSAVTNLWAFLPMTIST